MAEVVGCRLVYVKPCSQRTWNNGQPAGGKLQARKCWFYCIVVSIPNRAVDVEQLGKPSGVCVDIQKVPNKHQYMLTPLTPVKVIDMIDVEM